MADRLDVVAVGVMDERAVVVRVVDRAEAGRAVVRAAGGDPRGVERADLGAPPGAERDVDLVGRLAHADPEVGLAGNTEAGDLLRAIERLRPADREVVSYRYLLGLDEAETAQALGCARGTVKSRLSRALERLRAELDPTPGGTRA